jgi:hypothetical protein
MKGTNESQMQIRKEGKNKYQNLKGKQKKQVGFKHEENTEYNAYETRKHNIKV